MLTYALLGAPRTRKNRQRIFKGRADLVNRSEATCDILVKAGGLADDCAAIAASHDGSRVLLDRQRPRVEIEIEGLESGKPSGCCI